MEMPEMDVVLPPFENPFYQPGIFDLGTTPHSDKGKEKTKTRKRRTKIPTRPKSGTKPSRVICKSCGASKSAANTLCSNTMCEAYREPSEKTRKRKSSGNIICRKVDQSGKECGTPKTSTRALCPTCFFCEETKGEIPPTKGELKSNIKRRNTKKRKHKKNHSKKKKKY